MRSLLEQAKLLKLTNLMSIFYNYSKPTGAIRVTGEDAEDYLQSQWTINVKTLKPDNIGYGLRLSTKGRVLADAYFLRLDEEEFMLFSRGCTGSNIISLLEENIVADEVEFLNESNDWKWITFWNDNEKNQSTPPNFPSPQSDCFDNFKNGFFFKDFCISKNSYALLHPASESIEPNDAYEEVSLDELNKRRLKSGLPSVPSEIGPSELPQEGRLENLAIDFNKGCYLGQEVMARIHAMGRVRKQTISIRWHGTKAPELPCPVVLGEKNVGSLKTLFPQDKQYFIGTALIHETGIDVLKKEGLSIVTHGEEKIHIF